MSLIENEIIKELERSGIQAELSLTDLSETGAAAENLQLSKDGEVLLRAHRAEVDYVWREAIEGRFQSLKIVRPEISLKIDADGKIINPFGSGSGGGGAGEQIPPGGVTVTDGKVEIESPIGSLSVKIDAEFKSESDIRLNADINPSTLKYGDLSGAVSGRVDVKISQGTRLADIDLRASDWRYKNMSGQDLKLKGQSRLEVGDAQVFLRGPLQAELEDFKGKAVEASDIKLDWTGEIGLTRGDKNTVLADGSWNADIGHFSVTKANIRSDLAETLSLYSSLSRTPVTRDFAAPLKDSVAALMVKASARGSGRVSKNADSIRLNLDEPLVWKTANNTAELLPDETKDEFVFSRESRQIKLGLNADMGGPYPLKFRDGTLVLKSTNGRNIKGTESVAGNITLPRSWSSETPEGRAVKIRPLTSRVRYKGGEGARRLALSGRLSYDGDIPGGYAQALEAEGDLDVRLGAATEIFFVPKPDTAITMTRFENPTEWTASNVRFELAEMTDRPLFKLRNQQGKLSAKVVNLESDLANLDSSRTLSFRFGGADITADMAETQSWKIVGTDVQMTSDNTPTVGTVMSAPSTTITALLNPEGPPEFTIDAPLADVRTLSVDADGLAVQVAGTPDRFRVNYQDGQVEFNATDFPRFGMTGYVDFENDQWIGRADSNLPFDENTPINIDYRFIDGRGYADVDVPQMEFSPSGLQPQSFIPALQGKIADVRGLASAKINLEFSETDGVVSSGTAKLIEMEMGTAPGPLTGLNSELKFSSFFPLVTEGPQTVAIKSWDVGMPLPDGVIEFEAIPDGIRVLSARWPMGTGEVSLDPATWNYTAASNRMQLRVKNVSLGEMMGDFGGESFEVTGSVSGVLPVIISGVEVEVENGTLAVTDGGVVRFSTPFTDKAGESSGYAQLAFDALKEFYYEELELSLNGPLDGLVNIRAVFDGFNPNLMEGAYIRYNVNIEGELFNIVRNFQRLGANITDEVKNAVLDKGN